MDMSDHQLDAATVEELLGAYAIDACDLDETEAIEHYLDQNPTLAREAERLRRAASWIGATEALEPPAGLREAILARAHGGSEPAHDSLDLFVGQTRAFAEVVDEVTDDQLDRDTWNGLSVRDLVVHCAAQESLVAQLIGEPTLPAVTETDIERRTREVLDEFEGRSTDETMAVWEESVEAVRSWAADPVNRDTSVSWLGGQITMRDVLAIRSFESWIHADDIRRALGRPLATPPARHLSVMSDLSGRTTGFGLLMIGRSRPDRTARLVLTGDGGGDWLIAMGGGDAGATPDVTVTADVVDWCRLVGERLAPDELEYTVDGDAALAGDLLAAACAFATL
jgi:uncharacterized protein (TIGR03083 family)